ncbi:8195_t:CDS:2 [Dentiscutata erythropus]|uniref:8195_t:CDS:1 n=1 Tax=Dentiscutata erythropus TaxID=1348616 RepID=A0A9N8W6B5_9GLOM|nr:8195_t:CDS:2 [Dentiscutata erythropus]
MSQRRKGYHPGGKRQKQPKVCVFIILPPEMFINVCQYLPPKDLLSLARVCKRFNGYLSAETSTTTQEIWRASRTSYLPYLQMSPPEGMTERQYVKLVLERGCQFCDRSKIRKVYWEFFVRSCEDCLKDRIQRKEDLLPEFMNDGRSSDDVIAGLTYIPSWVRRSYYMRNSRMCPSSLYWIDDIIKTVEEYQNLPLHARNDWIKQKKEEGMAKMREVNQRRLDYDRGMRELVQQNSAKKNERSRLIKSRIQTMKNEKNSNNCLKYDSNILEECPTYLNHMFMQIRQSPQPFTERSWVLLKKKLLREYEERRTTKRQERQNKERLWPRSIVVQMRQYDIYQLAKNWLPDSSLEDTTADSADSNMNVNMNNSNSTQDTFKKSEMKTTTDVTVMDIENSDSDNVPINITNSNGISISDILNTDVNDNDNIVDLTVESDKEVIDLTDESETNLTIKEKSELSQDIISIQTYNSSLITLPPISLLPPIQPLDLNYITFPNLYTQPLTLNDYGLSFPSNDTNFQQSIFDWSDWFIEDTFFTSYVDDDNINNMQNLLINKYLPWCPSFRNPPFHDNNPYNLWDEEFLMSTLMPKIWNEAKELHKKSNDVVTNVQGAVLGGYKEYNIFKCKICKLKGDNYEETSYLDVRRHLQILHLGHDIYHLDDEEMIDVDVCATSFNKGISLDNIGYNDTRNFLFSIGYNFNLLNDLVKF